MAKCYITRNGFLAGSSPEILKQGAEYERSGDRSRLSSLIQEGKIIRLKGNDMVDVVERSVQYRMLKAKFKSGKTYWTFDGSLIPLKDGK